MIADLTYGMRRRTIRPGEAPPTEDELRSGLSDATLSGVFNGKPSNPGLVYDIARALGGDIYLAREAKRLTGLIRAKAEQIRAKEDVATETAALFRRSDRLGPRRSARPEPARYQAHKPGEAQAHRRDRARPRHHQVRHEEREDQPGLPALNPAGFLADPGPARIIAGAMTGDGTSDAAELGQAWADAFLGGTRTRDLTEDASEFIGYIRKEPGLLPPLRDLSPAAGPNTTRGFADEPMTARRATLKALEQAASEVREELADVTRPSPPGQATQSGTCRRSSARTCTTRPASSPRPPATSLAASSSLPPCARSSSRTSPATASSAPIPG